MVQTPAARPRGRPAARTDAETLALLGEAATAAFGRHGYAGANVTEIARSLGISTRTLYRLVPTKAELFELSVRSRIDSFLLAVTRDALSGLELEDALTLILTRFATLVLGDESMAITRLLYAEAGRFPEIAARFQASAARRVDAAITAWLAEQVEAGRLTVEQPGFASSFLRGAMVSDPQRAALLGTAPLPDAGAIAERARRCARLFLQGCRPR
ncbi:TetR/AcrR family transcriptional regulator [Rhizosaccharibacter radicis]|uniref:TetR/AcrR family transcriptional regulator n=1 Tax=Rhizosaccharibacter radicis TaxID=2782605 RepID=A0ABT1VYB3_9PROT|nr:TetR/AcrR family transcriptional regulator [Acetobacteraceae bacterium KSS12]